MVVYDLHSHVTVNCKAYYRNRSRNVFSVPPVQGDGMTISPPRGAVHLFGAGPLWTDTAQADLLSGDTDDSKRFLLNSSDFLQVLSILD